MTPTVRVACFLALAGTAPAQDKKADPTKPPVALKVKADKEKLKVGDQITFKITVANNSDAAVKLDFKPEKHFNSGKNALVGGEFFRHRTTADAKPTLKKPDLLTWGGKQPLLATADETVTLKAGEEKTFSCGAVLKAFHDDAFNDGPPKDHTPRLVFDDYKSSVNRHAPAFAVAQGKMTLTLVYERGGTKTESNDVTLEIDLGKKK